MRLLRTMLLLALLTIFLLGLPAQALTISIACLGGTDVFCSGQSSATRNVGATGGATNCVESVPDLRENK
jgi:hypothetical protein